ncbi:hypothetical protein BDW62DRAFT_195499 [Aspergillus aurantiobrunneus]
MSSSIHYEPLGGDFQNETAGGVTENTRLRHSSAASSVSELDANEQHAPAQVELPAEFPASTFEKNPENIIDSKQKPPWQDPVRWCMWGNIAVLVINIIFTIVAVGVSASKGRDHGFGSIMIYRGSCTTTQYMKFGLHLLVNVLSVTMTATSSYCCTIIMAPSRSDVDKAHAKGTWLSIGVGSWRNFRNLEPPGQVLWGLLLVTSMVMQMVYNSVVYSSLNAYTYPALVAPVDFVSNTSLPTTYYEDLNCYPENILGWNVTDLRTEIFNGAFEYLNKEDCLNTYATSYLSDRSTVVLVTNEPLPGDGVLLAGYGYPGGITNMDPSTNLSANWFNLNYNYRQYDNAGHDWMCYAHGPLDATEACSSGWIQGFGDWNVSAQEWARQTRVELKTTWQNITFSQLVDHVGSKSILEQQLNATDIDWTESEIKDLLSYVETNPTPEQMRAYINHSAWINSVSHGVNISAFCPTAGEVLSDLHEVRVDHCLSLKTGEACGLYYQVPIAFTIIICGLVKVICMWLLLRTDRFELFLTMGDAISSFLQRPDVTTKDWCTLSADMLSTKECPWNEENTTFEKEGFVPQEAQPSTLLATRKTWNKASSGRIWLMTWFAMLSYIVISLLFPALAATNGATHAWTSDRPLTAIWQIKGWGDIESTALLSSYVTSFVGSVLVSNTPQLAVSFLYYCLNDSLTRYLLAADYNKFAICRRPLRVSFPRGEQRSTFYLTIPYRFAIPSLGAFTLIHWFVSEGLFYVQVLPYGLDAQLVPSEALITCGVSTIPLITGLLLGVALFLIVSFMGTIDFKSSRMPLALGRSVVVSAACHPPRLDLDAAYKPVQWGVVGYDVDAEFPHCSFTSEEVKEPEDDVRYA